MRESKTERVFGDQSRYPKRGGTSLDVIEKVKAERGFIDLDDPNQKRQFKSNEVVSFNPKIDGDRKIGVKNAKVKHQKALKNLDQGTAVMTKGIVKAKPKPVAQPKSKPDVIELNNNIKEVQGVMLDSVCEKWQSGGLSLVQIINEIKEIKEVGLKMAYKEFERIATERGSTVKEIIRLNRKQ